MLLVQLGINSTHDVWKFCQIGLVPAAHPMFAKFPNINHTNLDCSCHRMITYTCTKLYIITINYKQISSILWQLY
jgi:hypothetical protein